MNMQGLHIQGINMQGRSVSGVRLWRMWPMRWWRTGANEAVEYHPGGAPRGNRYFKITQGNSSSYCLRRLARRAPDVLAAWERGEFPSVEAAYRHAFALDALRRAWKEASDDDRATFKAEIADESTSEKSGPVADQGGR